VEDGTIQKQLSNQASEKTGELIKVGINRFGIDEDDRELEVFEVDPKTISRQIPRLKQVKSDRDHEWVKNVLKILKQTATEKRNLMPSILDAVRAYATVGEMVNTLKEVYGEAQHIGVF